MIEEEETDEEEEMIQMIVNKVLIIKRSKETLDTSTGIRNSSKICLRRGQV